MFKVIGVPAVATLYQFNVLAVLPGIPVIETDPPTLIVELDAETVGAAGDPITIIAPEIPDVVLGQDDELTIQ